MELNSTPEKFQNATITGGGDRSSAPLRGRVNHMTIVTSSFSENLRFSVLGTDGRPIHRT